MTQQAPSTASPTPVPTRPLHEVRLGRVKVCIWPNGADKGDTWYSVTVGRLYKDGDTWKTSESFGRDDILLLCKALDMALTWTYQQQG
jgi:hypothetical protein